MRQTPQCNAVWLDNSGTLAIRCLLDAHHTDSHYNENRRIGWGDAPHFKPHQDLVPLKKDDRVLKLAEYLYERDWKGRRFNSEEQMRSRPTFAQLLTGETALVQPWSGGTDYGKYEREEARRRLEEARFILNDVVSLLLEKIKE